MRRKELKYKEYWSPREAAEVLGRSRKYWATLFDERKVEGYCTISAGGHRRRHIKAESARQHLDRLSTVPIPPSEPPNNKYLNQFRQRLYKI